MSDKENFPKQHQEEQPGKQHLMNPEPEVIKKNYKAAGKLQGKVALITGGDSGIGRSVALHFSKEGASVAIVYTPEEEKDAFDTKAMVEDAGQDCLLLSGDLKNTVFCAEIVEKTVERFGKLNILVNNAAEQRPKETLEEVSDDQLESTFETNIFAYFRVARAAVKYLQQGDSIINTTSVTSFRGSAQLLDYSSTKGAITSFTRSLSINLAKKGIRVNGVSPGPIWTPLIPSTFDKEKVASFGTNVPLGRAGQPSEVAPCFVFLASDDASYITGQTLHPNGGEVINT
ncbi:MAG TPA: SDR family oxidoreductase [Cytophagales bacterium]|nr:SDR family oxidoreductase [Cytophagales bacterium]